jgi:hypothetical protein
MKWSFAAACLLSASPASAETLFTSGWENGAPGCGFDELLDTGAWREYGSANACASECNAGGPDASVVTRDAREGAQALEVRFPPSTACLVNGPDFRVLASFAASTELYARFYVKWSDEWVWAGADHKVAIFGLYDQTQDIYFNIRGQPDDTKGRVAIGVTPADVVFSDPNHELTRGAWYLLEIHIVSGAHGSVAVRVDGVDLALEHEAGTPGIAPDDVDTGAGVDYIKLDTTYNDYQYAVDNGATMRMLYDAVTVNDGDGWIGPVDGNPSGATSSSSAGAGGGPATASAASSGAGGRDNGSEDQASGCAFKATQRASIWPLCVAAMLIGMARRRSKARPTDNCRRRA